MDKFNSRLNTAEDTIMVWNIGQQKMHRLNKKDKKNGEYRKEHKKYKEPSENI